MQRRTFIKAVTMGAGAAIVSSCGGKDAASRPDLAKVSALVSHSDAEIRTWLGKDFWGNRLQDWRYNHGRLECLNGNKEFEVRTVSVLTRELNNSHKPARLRVRLRPSNETGEGYAGFLLGVGAGKLDYRGAALANRVAGEGGGFMAVIDRQGDLSFRDFSDSNNPLNYEKYGVEGSQTQTPIFAFNNRDVILDCHIDPTEDGLFDVRLIAFDAATEVELGFIVRSAVPAEEVQGGIMLLSSPNTDEAGAVWSFEGLETGGAKIDVDAARGLYYKARLNTDEHLRFGYVKEVYAHYSGMW